MFEILEKTPAGLQFEFSKQGFCVCELLLRLKIRVFQEYCLVGVHSIGSLGGFHSICLYFSLKVLLYDEFYQVVIVNVEFFKTIFFMDLNIKEIAFLNLKYEKHRMSIFSSNN